MSALVTDPRTLAEDEVNLLLAWLADETQAQHALLDVLTRQQECMVNQDLDGLQACHETAAPAARRLEGTTRSRAQVLQGLSKRLGLENDPPRVGPILERLPEARRDEVVRARDALSEVLTDVRRQTRSNRALARTGLDVNRSIVHAVFAGGEAQRTYDGEANTLDVPPTQPFLDREL